MAIMTYFKPQRRTCGAMAMHMRMLETDANLRRVQADLEAATARRMSQPHALSDKEYHIPVVVHVIHNTDDQNIPKAQIVSQITILNRDFRGANADKKKVPKVWQGLVADTRINFSLATTDPNGKPTSGITRTRTKIQAFPDDDSMKSSKTGGHDTWPTDRYLNIWVCPLGSGLLGYAQFPGGNPFTDGVVILHSAFGNKGTATAPFDLGRTTTHEVGHFLNLRHIWADTENCTGTDFVEDTPNAAGPNYGKPTFPSISCSNGPDGDMFMNYMDYVDDDSMFLFTPQQVVRMHATLDGPRQGLSQ
jgi:hypothetical protein